MSGDTLRDRISSVLLNAVGTKPSDLTDRDRDELGRLLDALAEVVSDEIHGLAENLPQSSAPTPARNAPERTLLLATGWETGYTSARDATHEYLISRCREIRPSKAGAR